MAINQKRHQCLNDLDTWYFHLIRFEHTIMEIINHNTKKRPYATIIFQIEYLLDVRLVRDDIDVDGGEESAGAVTKRDG